LHEHPQHPARSAGGAWLEGLKERLLAPEVAAEAMRAYAEEMNRLNRERRLSVHSDRRALADVERKIKDVVTVIEKGGYKPTLLDRLDELELQRGRARVPSRPFPRQAPARLWRGGPYRAMPTDRRPRLASLQPPARP
jgi:hypothetical protein